ncbi:hypothetical protein CAPTEDRAFT_151168 [Capitella teleta]|uniref:Uncharacterized protein n=1 Tax=Capitella teleta TaxID=283909 RepID=R7UHT0_CAPTE|nr:hypothetical protein CAPTEDRAFT_151168 [Capitella teleta]|eukprot:ELU05770.1 hypothetical protein CAPTEDRAFT_151168 [Capitella teleta]
MSDFANGKPMKYPYTVLGRLARFPWAYHWQHSQVTRAVAYSIVICAPLFMFIDKTVNMTENRIIWDAKRKNRQHDPFPTMDHRKDL